MKARFSADYYETNWSRFMENKSNLNQRYMNLEEDLHREISCIEGILSGEQFAKVVRVFAARVAERAEKMLKEDMEIAKRIDKGEANFGYTTNQQEISAQYNFRSRFEFNCYQLSKFKAKYGIAKI